MAGPAGGVDLLGSTVRRRIMDTLANLPTRTGPDGALRRAEGLTAQELATLLELHVTTVRYHLDQLVAADLLASRFRRGDGVGRPRKVYVVEPGSLRDVAAAESFRLLSELLVESFRLAGDRADDRAGDGPDDRGDPDPGVTPEEAGASWSRRHAVALLGVEPGTAAHPARSAGQWLGKVGLMVDLLRDWGYVPEVTTSTDGRRVEVTLRSCPFLELARSHTPVVCGIHRGLIRGAMGALGEEDVDVGLVPFVTPATCLAAVTTYAPFDHHTRTTPPPTPEETR